MKNEEEIKRELEMAVKKLEKLRGFL